MNKVKRFTAIMFILLILLRGCTPQRGNPGEVYSPAPLTETEIVDKLQQSLDYLVIGLGNNWAADSSSPMYRSVSSAVFRRILEIQYEHDTGNTFDYFNIDGNRDIFISTAMKHFPLNEDELKVVFKRRGVYNKETDTILPADGLGCVAEAELTEWKMQDENIIAADYNYIIPDGISDGYITRKGTLLVQINEDNSFKFLSNHIEPDPHTLHEDLSFLPDSAKEFFDKNRQKALSFSQSGGTFVYGQHKAFDLRKISQPVEIDGLNYLVTTTSYEEGIEFLRTIFHDDIVSELKRNDKYAEIDGMMAFLDTDGPYVGMENMSGYRVFDNIHTKIDFTQQIYTDPQTGFFTGIHYELVKTDSGWRFYRAEYILE